MKRRTVFLLGVALSITVFVGSFGVLGPPAEAASKVYKWKMQSMYPHGDISMELLYEFAAAAEKRSNGQLKISVFADPEIVPAEQALEATKKGVLDAMQYPGISFGGIVPVGLVEFGLPYAYAFPEGIGFEESAERTRKFYFDSGFVDILREEYGKQDLFYLDMHTYGPVPTILSTKPLRNCEDIKGVKIRDDGGHIMWFNLLGMRGTVMQATDTYMALKLGTLDAADWDISAITGLKWHEVAPYWIRGGNSDHVFGGIAINMESWNELPDDVKEAVKGAGEDFWHVIVQGYKKELVTVDEMVKNGTVKEVWLDADCQKKFEDAAYQVWEEIAAQDETSARVIQWIKDWRAAGMK
jgi:TRAP-type C4-dicarboxylate transport system substrate-binding protein